MDLVILDIMMPGLDGLDVLRRLRGAVRHAGDHADGARRDETDRVVGLELGADRLPREAGLPAGAAREDPRGAAAGGAAGARSAVGLRRSRGGSGVAVAAQIGGETLALTALEFDLLLALAERAGRVVSRDVLWEAAGRGDTAVGERTVDVHVSRLRAKLGDDARSPRRLKTVRGAGYLLVREPS